MNNLGELEKKYKELGEEIEKLKKQGLNKRWRAEEGQRYWYIESTGNICWEYEYFTQESNFRYSTGNYFKNLEEAEKEKEKLLIYMQLKDLTLRLNDGEKIDWDNDEQNKYFIYYDYGINQIDCGIGNIEKELGQIYCIKEGFLVKALEEIGEENLKLLFGVEE